jgi:hypothetical protein
MTEIFPGQAKLDAGLDSMRAVGDQLRECLDALDARVKASFVSAADMEVAYAELWTRMIRDLAKELDKRIGHVRDLNAKRAAHLWLSKDVDSCEYFGRSFRIDLTLLPSLPKKGSRERAELIQWLYAGDRGDCLVIDEATGEPVFDYDKMTELCNAMVEQGAQPPASIKLHPKAKIIVRQL